jgi:hypothetical protein
MFISYLLSLRKRYTKKYKCISLALDRFFRLVCRELYRWRYHSIIHFEEIRIHKTQYYIEFLLRSLSFSHSFSLEFILNFCAIVRRKKTFLFNIIITSGLLCCYSHIENVHIYVHFLSYDTIDFFFVLSYLYAC